MFVNISPADYNVEETQTSLVYAARVKLITNSAEKQQESAEVARLKKIIARLQKGERLDEEELKEEPAPPPAAPDEDAPPHDDDDAAAAAGGGGGGGGAGGGEEDWAEGAGELEAE
jgi:hypothetical protein